MAGWANSGGTEELGSFEAIQPCTCMPLSESDESCPSASASPTSSWSASSQSACSSAISFSEADDNSSILALLSSNSVSLALGDCCVDEVMVLVRVCLIGNTTLRWRGMEESARRDGPEVVVGYPPKGCLVL